MVVKARLDVELGVAPVATLSVPAVERYTHQKPLHTMQSLSS